MEQRAGRTIRQGNTNEKITIFRYVTEETFDAYLYQILENKQKFISQIMTSKSPVRSCDDIDETALSYAEIKALATGNPYIKEKMDLDIKVSKLKLIKANHLSQKYSLEDKLLKYFPTQIKKTEERINAYETDIAHFKENSSLALVDTEESKFMGMTIKDIHYTEKAEAGKALIEACKGMSSSDAVNIGSYMGFDMYLSFDSFDRSYQVALKNEMSHKVTLGVDAIGNITRLNNALSDMPKKLDYQKEQLITLTQQTEDAKVEVQKPFSQEAELVFMMTRLNELNALLNVDEKETYVIDEEPEEETSQRKTHELER